MNHQDRSTKLRELGLIPTIQRLAVLEFLEDHLIHPTADEVYQGVKDRFPSLSKATVYNVLDALKRAGAIKELTISRQAARYDVKTHLHPHFMCRVCGRVYDIDTAHVIHAGDVVNGHRVESVQTYIYGVCADCFEKAADRNDKSTMHGRENA